ncbi:PucR family transcriptional regulator [Streptomyces sp. ALI-76-A]|uniref:helix-turn-helix domain-containing protein n=1 Tax=Streptomyces sp. ALI-76-A TaxID=3025736 RepID=UPI00256F59DB|nr:PucR family transcriptional regulator [Streptomyces sp. ALI-76-A]MDL5199606.1 helix-turn-helix domain-containing protein [Streptomyces sp. ALI-76-A]
MPTLGSLPTDKPELELAFLASGSQRAQVTEIAGVVTVTPEQLLENGPPSALPDGSLVLITDASAFRLRGRITTVLELLLQRMSRDGSAGLAVTAAPGARQPFPPTVVDRAARLGIALLITSAPAERWEGMHEQIQLDRLMFAERRAAQLSSLVQELPARLADSRAMQRIADWLARVLDCQVLVSEPERVLAASPATAAEQLARAIIRQSVDGVLPDTLSGPHTQLISLAPASAADTVLAVARKTPFDEADLRLLRHAAKLLGLVDQAHREYRAASGASHAARSAAFELLLDGEVEKARRVMANLAPGLLEPESARVFVVETAQARRGLAARSCTSSVGQQALVVPDPRDDRRILIVHPIRSDDDTGAEVSAELTRLVGALGPPSSLGGSGVYSMTLLADALNEAITAQRFAAFQPDSVALSVHGSDLVSLLPQAEAQQWARRLLNPLMHDETQWESMRETLPAALAYPYTVAARRLRLHRNTVMRRASRAAELLRMDFTSISDRIAVALAMELVTQREVSASPRLTGSEPPSLARLLGTPQVRAWAQTLIRPVQADRRDLVSTALAWLTFDTRVEPAARALGLSEVTVRSHLRALEGHMQRDLATLVGVRDLQFSLHVVTGQPDLRSDRPGMSVVA